MTRTPRSKMRQGLQGATDRSAADPLSSPIVESSPGSIGFGRGNSGVFDTNNNAVGEGETLRIDGRSNRTFDASVVHFSTISFADGTTASNSVVIFQDIDGRGYLAPELTANGKQLTLGAKPIQSIRLGTLTQSLFRLRGTRQPASRPHGDVATEERFHALCARHKEFITEGMHAEFLSRPAGSARWSASCPVCGMAMTAQRWRQIYAMFHITRIWSRSPEGGNRSLVGPGEKLADPARRV